MADKLEFCEKKQDWDTAKIVWWAEKKYAPERYVEKLQKVYKKICNQE